MDKEQIIKIIHANKNLPYDEVKQQAIEAGVELYIFEEAWNSIIVKDKKKKKRNKVLLIASGSIVAVLAIVFVFAVYGGGVKLSYKGGGCSAIQSNEECKKYADCNSVWGKEEKPESEEDEEEPKEVEERFMKCADVPKSKMKLSEMCYQTLGYWKSGDCDCSIIKQGASDRADNGPYVFLTKKGCVTEKQKCRDWKGVWGQYRTETQDGWPGEGVDFVVVKNRYVIIIEDLSQPLGCLFFD